MVDFGEGYSGALKECEERTCIYLLHSVQSASLYYQPICFFLDQCNTSWSTYKPGLFEERSRKIRSAFFNGGLDVAHPDRRGLEAKLYASINLMVFTADTDNLHICFLCTSKSSGISPPQSFRHNTSNVANYFADIKTGILGSLPRSHNNICQESYCFPQASARGSKCAGRDSHQEKERDC